MLKKLLVAVAFLSMGDYGIAQETTTSTETGVADVATTQAVNQVNVETTFTEEVEDTLSIAELERELAKIIQVPAHPSQLIALQATATSRTENLNRWRAKMQEAFTTAPLAEHEDTWSTAFWASTILPADDLSREGVQKALDAYETLPDEFRRTSLEAAYGVDPQRFVLAMAEIAEKTDSPKHYAMAILYLVRGLPDASMVRRDALAQMIRRFPEWHDHPILIMLYHDLVRGSEKDSASDLVTTKPETVALQCAERPPLAPLLSRRFAPGFPVVYTFQRKDRSWPGVAVVRKPDGTFHRTPDGRLFQVSHLARSRTNLPGYITNGNTPQGVFTIQGLGRSRSRAIGQTPYLHTFVPHELSPEKYFHKMTEPGTTWTLDMYRTMLPDADGTATSWRNYLPIYTAYYAGKAGRGDMLSHGTTVDPEFYAGKPWYPATPTSGCICAKEMWDAGTGKALMSDQLALVLAYLECSGYNIPRDDDTAAISVAEGPAGFFVLIELDGKTQPVTLDEVLTDLLAAESLT